jgi:citrate synthase
MSDVSEWWSTSIIEMEPGSISLRGMPIENLIGNKSFVEMIWLMTTGDQINEKKSALLEAALVAAVDHGPQAPSIAAARMSATCGVDINNSLATGINVLGDIHGGAGQQALELYVEIKKEGIENIDNVLKKHKDMNGGFIPGFGHRFHKPTDPRAPRLIELVNAAADQGEVSGTFSKIACEIEERLSNKKPVPMNIDGATAVIYAELGCPPPLARGLFCISRSVGILAHTWEQMQQDERIKGPTPPSYGWKYKGNE